MDLAASDFPLFPNGSLEYVIGANHTIRPEPIISRTCFSEISEIKKYTFIGPGIIALVLGLSGGTNVDNVASDKHYSLNNEQAEISSATISEIGSGQPATEEQQINGLRTIFGANLSEIAAMLGVSRTAVYDWIKSNNLSSKNRARFEEVQDLAYAWKNMEVGRLGGYLHRVISPHTQSVFQLLTQKSLNKAEIIALFKDISEMIKEKQIILAEQAKFLEKHGIKTPSEKEAFKDFNKFISSIG